MKANYYSRRRRLRRVNWYKVLGVVSFVIGVYVLLDSYNVFD